jgi:small redox-active disulfide protein 2
MNIQILGSGCNNCKRLEQLSRDAVAEMGLDATIEKITDFDRIGKMGVMATPGFAIDNVVKSTGKVLTKDQIIQFLKGGKS